ncbi:MAG: prephenate dehydrogenase/arogenate dehydrogenase family protein [Candidatus Bathyarchaeia archaeon]
MAIVGGAGKMGSMFVKYFLGMGHEVIFSDINRKQAKLVAGKTGAKLAEDNGEAVSDADLSIISTPLETVPKVLNEIAVKLKESSTVMEISSLKSQAISVLKEVAKRKVKTLCVHPLFGPGAENFKNEKIAVIPVAEPVLEVKMTKNLFPDAEIIVVDAEEHDRVMALTLSLCHFVNIVFASVISEEKMDIIKKLGGTTFTLQSILSEGVMTENSLLYASIQIKNKYTSRYLEKFMSKAEILKGYIDRKDSENFIKFYLNVQNSLSKDKDFAEAYDKIYKALKSL